MSHSINLLQPGEIRYLSAAASNPLYKYAGIGLGVVILASAAFYFLSLRETAAKGERLQSRWEEIEEDVARVEDLNASRLRLEKAVQTLQGWESSRVPWDEVMEYLVDSAPGSLEDIQFTRLQWNETMEGLQKQSPSDKKADFHPLKRVIDINLRGILRSNRPERLLTQFRRNLLEGRAPVEIEEVALDRYTQLRDEEGNVTDRTTFSFTIRLVPRELMP
jgi:Tfp pilus assembly protein PilN